MTINKAIKYMFFMFENGHWSITKNSSEAMNTVAEFVEKKQDEQLRNNHLFAKLYITYYSELIKFYKSTVFDNEPQKELHKTLDMPIERIIENFIKIVNDIEQSRAMEIDGVLKHPRSWTESERESIKLTESVVDYEMARENLTAMVNLALDEFS